MDESWVIWMTPSGRTQTNHPWLRASHDPECLELLLTAISIIEVPHPSNQLFSSTWPTSQKKMCTFDWLGFLTSVCLSCQAQKKRLQHGDGSRYICAGPEPCAPHRVPNTIQVDDGGDEGSGTASLPHDTVTTGETSHMSIDGEVFEGRCGG